MDDNSGCGCGCLTAIIVTVIFWRKLSPVFREFSFDFSVFTDIPEGVKDFLLVLIFLLIVFLPLPEPTPKIKYPDFVDIEHNTETNIDAEPEAATEPTRAVYDEDLMFLSEACNNEFSLDEISHLRNMLVTVSIPETGHGTQIDKYHYLVHVYQKMNLESKKRKIKNRFFIHEKNYRKRTRHITIKNPLDIPADFFTLP